LEEANGRLILEDWYWKIDIGRLILEDWYWKIDIGRLILEEANLRLILGETIWYYYLAFGLTQSNECAIGKDRQNFIWYRNKIISWEVYQCEESVIGKEWKIRDDAKTGIWSWNMFTFINHCFFSRIHFTMDSWEHMIHWFLNTGSLETFPQDRIRNYVLRLMWNLKRIEHNMYVWASAWLITLLLGLTFIITFLTVTLMMNTQAVQDRLEWFY
jgi:hypothetical protein